MFYILSDLRMYERKRLFSNMSHIISKNSTKNKIKMKILYWDKIQIRKNNKSNLTGNRVNINI